MPRTRDDRLGPRGRHRLPAGRPRPGHHARRRPTPWSPSSAPTPNASTSLVRDFTGLHARASATAPVLVVDRAGWIQANADGFARRHRAADREAAGQARRVQRRHRGGRLQGHRRSRSAACSASCPRRCSASSTRSPGRARRQRHRRRPAAAGRAEHRARRARARRRPDRLPAVGVPARGDPPGAVHRRAVDARPHPAARSSDLVEAIDLDPAGSRRCSARAYAGSATCVARRGRRQPPRRVLRPPRSARSSTASPA